MSPDAAYLHGTSPAEQGRLSLLNRLMNEAALRELSLQGGERIVDFGCGLGQLSLAMARAAKTRLVGIERSEEQLQRAERHELLDLRRGDVLDPPLSEPEWGSFDLAHARFVLEHVQDPLRVVRSEEHTSELQSPDHLVCRLLLEKKKTRHACAAEKQQPRREGQAGRRARR